MTTKRCPPAHTEYASEMLANNAVLLHGMAHPTCPGGFRRFPCGDHFHVGHKNATVGDACKAADDRKKDRL